MPRSKPANHTSRILLFASDSKNSVLAEMAGSIHRLAYSPYGQQSSRQKVMAHLGFNGELREPTSGWYLLGNGHRAYNPQLMRFHSPDKLSPFGRGGLNTYMYCGGEPVMNVDPTGRSFWSRALKIWDFFSLSNTSSGPRRNALSAPVKSGRGGLWEVADAIATTPQGPIAKSRPKKGGGKRKHAKPSWKKPGNAPSSSSILVPSAFRNTAEVITPIGARPGSNPTSSHNHGIRKLENPFKVSTTDGLTITGIDSGEYAYPSTSQRYAADIRR